MINAQIQKIDGDATTVEVHCNGNMKDVICETSLLVSSIVTNLYEKALIDKVNKHEGVILLFEKIESEVKKNLISYILGESKKQGKNTLETILQALHKVTTENVKEYSEPVRIIGNKWDDILNHKKVNINPTSKEIFLKECESQGVDPDEVLHYILKKSLEDLNK